MQVPPAQRCMAPHATPHPPQFIASIMVFTHTPSQSSPAGQPQTPSMQPPIVQRMSQPPQ